MTTLHTVNLTAHQKEVLVRIYTSPTPEIAKAETEFDEKNIAAADMLHDLEAIEITDEGAKVTATGIDLMRQQGLIDDSDQLTQEAEQYKAGDGTNTTDDVDMGGAEGDFGDMDLDSGEDLSIDNEFDFGSDEDQTKAEGFSLLKSLTRLSENVKKGERRG